MRNIVGVDDKHTDGHADHVGYGHTYALAVACNWSDVFIKFMIKEKKHATAIMNIMAYKRA